VSSTPEPSRQSDAAADRQRTPEARGEASFS
jgi:hypothetical protein